jgi:pimeloyl-ACP methyl ester carboxylesterase
VVRARLVDRAEAMSGAGIAGWGPKVSPGIFSPATFAARPETIGLFEELFDTQDVGAYLRSLEILIRASAASSVPRVAVPCLAITGEDDQYAPPEAVRAFMAGIKAPHDVEVLPGAGHMPFFEPPSAFAALVGGFLDRV